MLIQKELTDIAGRYVRSKTLSEYGIKAWVYMWNLKTTGVCSDRTTLCALADKAQELGLPVFKVNYREYSHRRHGYYGYRQRRTELDKPLGKFNRVIVWCPEVEGGLDVLKGQ
jgi:hypothetical protein